jgi:hypothetical protein
MKNRSSSRELLAESTSGPGAPEGTVQPARLELILTDSEDRLRPFKSSWNRLALNHAHGSLTSTHAWVISFLKHRLPKDRDWRCLLVLDRNNLVGVMPFTISKRVRMTYPSTHLMLPHDLDTTSVDLVMTEHRECEIANVVFESIEESVPGWFELSMIRIPEESPSARLVDTEPVGVRVYRQHNGFGCVVDTSREFESYRDSLSRNFRKNLRRAERCLHKLNHVRTAFLESNDHSEDHFWSFLELESAGWKGREGTAIKASASLTAFYRELTDRLAAAGLLEWHFLYAERKPIAAQIAARAGRRLVIAKIAYDESYASCSPGNMLFLATLERAFASNEIDEVDCLTDMAWHRNWRMRHRSYFDLKIFPRRLHSTLCGYLPARVHGGLRRVKGVSLVTRAIRGLCGASIHV